MIDAVLADAEAAGKRGLVGKELVQAIDTKFWPGVGFNNIIPDAARLFKKGLLAKEGNLYMRIKNDEGSGAAAAEPSSDQIGGVVPT